MKAAISFLILVGTSSAHAHFCDLLRLDPQTSGIEIANNTPLNDLNKSSGYIIEATAQVPVLANFSEAHGRCEMGAVGWGVTAVTPGMKDRIVFANVYSGMRIGLQGCSGANWSLVECEFTSGKNDQMTYGEFKTLTRGRFKIIKTKSSN